MLAIQGLIEEEKLSRFNLPFYAPSATELGILIQNEGSFSLDQIHVSEVSWQPGSNYNTSNNSNNGAPYWEENMDNVQWYDFVKCMRSVSEALLTSHFGEGIIEEVYQRYSQVVRVSMREEKNAFVNVTVSMTRKG